MIKVLEQKKIPRAEVVCDNCGSKLEYGNADLLEYYSRMKESSNLYANYYGAKYWCITCPVCGCKVNAKWIKK